MSKFKKKKGGDLPAISTASLPDIVFMLLFFFMVATVMRDSTLMVANKLPAADQIQKLDKKESGSCPINNSQPKPIKIAISNAKHAAPSNEKATQ